MASDRQRSHAQGFLGPGSIIARRSHLGAGPFPGTHGRVSAETRPGNPFSHGAFGRSRGVDPGLDSQVSSSQVEASGPELTTPRRGSRHTHSENSITRVTIAHAPRAADVPTETLPPTETKDGGTNSGGIGGAGHGGPTSCSRIRPAHWFETPRTRAPCKPRTDAAGPGMPFRSNGTLGFSAKGSCRGESRR